MNIKLGESIRENRRRRGLTQEQLAEALGVTTGAVYKWESGRANPELEMLVELAAFFETSVDALLGYGWEKLGMGETAARLKSFVFEHRIDEGIRFAEQALQKYPNSFDVVYRSATLYFLSMRPENAGRAAELYKRSVDLLEQNTDGEIGLVTIQNRIADCYCIMGRTDEAVELLKGNNVGGRNNAQIGLYLSQTEDRADEALKYLSEAFTTIYGTLYNICIGYVNAYAALNRLGEAEEIINWFLTLSDGLRSEERTSFLDRGKVRLYTALANLSLMGGDKEKARERLALAYDLAESFDRDPEYGILAGMRFFSGTESATYYDSMGETAMSMIENYIKEDDGAALKPLFDSIVRERGK